MEENRAAKTFVTGAMLLGVAGILVKVFGLFFRIPLTNIIGADGMGYYQTAYPVYVFVLTISTSGLPTAISRMVSERRSLDQYYEAYRVFKTSFKVMLCLGVGSGLILFLFAPLITKLQMEPDAVYALRATVPAVILCPILSCYRGFFQGQKNMAPTAISQVIEQIFRVGLGIGLAVVLRKTLPKAAAGASFGASAGAFFGLVVIMILFHRNKANMVSEIRQSGRKPIQKTKSIIKDLLTIAIPITIGACIMPILNWIDTLIVKRRLYSIGYDLDVSRRMYGELSAMASPIINVPQVLTQTLVSSLVPVISDAHKRGDMDFVRKNVGLGLRYAFTVSLPCAVGMIVLSRPIMLLFYPTQKDSIENAAACLAIYAVGMIFLSSTHALMGVLQGIGRQTVPVRNLLIGAVVKAAVTFVLTGIPAINIRGAAIGTACAYFVAAALNLIAVLKETSAKLDLVSIFIKPFVSAAVMGVAVYFAFFAVHGKLGQGNTVSTVVSVICGVVIYALVMLLIKGITAEEFESVQKLRKVSGILKKLRLLR